MSKKSVLSFAALAALTSVVAFAPTASAAPGSATRNGHTITSSNADALTVSGETITVTGSGYDPNKGFYISLCAVPDDYSYGQKPSPCQGGDGQGGSGVGPSAWVTNSPLGGGNTVPIAADGTFTAKIHIKQNAGGLDCTVKTCAVVSRRDHFGPSDRSFDVFIPAFWS